MYKTYDQRTEVATSILTNCCWMSNKRIPKDRFVRRVRSGTAGNAENISILKYENRQQYGFVIHWS